MDLKTLLTKDCRVIIDTCSMMRPQFKIAMEKMIPVLEKSNKKLVVPESCVNELKKHAQNTKLSEKAINALRILRNNKEYISIKGDKSDSTHADSVFLRVCNQFYTKYYLIVITEDVSLRRDICNINKQESVRGNKIEVVSIDYIANYKENSSQKVKFSIQTKVSGKPDNIIMLNSVPKENSILKTNDGNEIHLKTEIRAGGEGTVYETDTVYVAKIYHKDKLSTRKKDKIDLLVNSGLVIDGVCFPEKSLFNENGEFVGYLMKKASGKSLDHSFFRGERGITRHFPGWTRLDVVELGITILSRINDLHRQGILIGDLNGANILVNSPSSVFFVDTDSFQINDLPCPVGTEVFTAPEIQGKDYKLFLRTEGNENFAVATLLFKLLMYGINPYAQKEGESIAKDIKSGKFSFPFKEKSNGKIPEGDWKFFWSHLFFPLKKQFYQTFAKGERYYDEDDRPEVKDWLKLLKPYKNQLADGTIANYDKQSVEMFPKSYKKSPNQKYLLCFMCKREVPEGMIEVHKGRYYCSNCLSKFTIVNCKSCGAQMKYTKYRELIDELPAPIKCKECRDKLRKEKEEKKREAERKRAEEELYRISVYKTITCVCCGKNFIITNGQNDFYQKKGYVLPKRCDECRKQGNRPNPNSGKSDSNESSGCFITTAVCDYYGKSDDCYELTMLRGFRDNWLVKQVDGESLIAYYYMNAPHLVDVMKRSEKYEQYCMILMNEFINPCISLINQGRNEECKEMYIKGVDYLLNELNNN